MASNAKGFFSSTYWKLNLWIAVILAPIGLIAGIIGLIIETHEPIIIDKKYAYYFAYPIGLKEVFIFKNRNIAISSFDKYEQNEPVNYKFLGHGDRIELKHNIPVEIIKYSKDSCVVKAKAILEISTYDTTYFVGWIPNNVLHDSSVVYELNRMYGR